MGVNNIFNGFWTNWEDGKTKGATLTLPRSGGAVLVAFLALYVQFSGMCFWRMVCFVTHQTRSTQDARDGLFHQQQIILRNAATAPMALWGFILSTMSWRSKVPYAFRKALPMLLLTLTHIAFFAAAGLLSSLVTQQSNGQAIWRPGRCGFSKELPNVRSLESGNLDEERFRVFTTEVLLARVTLSKSTDYVRTCYNDDTNGRTAACNVYVQPHLVGIGASVVENATCPFGSNACITPTAVRHDSGYLHSGSDLGINFPEQDSLTMRRVTQCAPIRVDNYATDWVRDIPEALVGGSNTSVKFYEFGKSSEGCDAAKKANQTADTTFCVSDYQKETYRRAYTVRSNTVYQNNQEVSDFVPVPDFQVANADVTLMSIFNKAVYAGNNSDALFKAETPVPNRPEGFPARFTASNDLAVLGCTEQYEFCNAGTQKCTGLAGVYAIKAALDSNVLGLNPRQNATSNLMWKGTWAMALQWAAEILSDDLLLARDWVFTTQSTQSSALPDNQWQLEAANLHNLSLATFQRRINDYASPESFQIRPDANSLDDIQPETDRYMRALCGAQKIRSNDHYSVSVLGMLIILCVGSAIILLDLSLEHIFFFRTVGFAPLSKKHDWENTGVLQLHRLVLETRGVGPWGGDPANPVLEDQHRKFEGGVALKQGWGSGSGYAASGREMMESQGSGGTAYQGGVQYSAVPNPQVQGETHLFWDKK